MLQMSNFPSLDLPSFLNRWDVLIYGGPDNLNIYKYDLNKNIIEEVQNKNGKTLQLSDQDEFTNLVFEQNQNILLMGKK